MYCGKQPTTKNGLQCMAVVQNTNSVVQRLNATRTSAVTAIRMFPTHLRVLAAVPQHSGCLQLFAKCGECNTVKPKRPHANIDHMSDVILATIATKVINSNEIILVQTTNVSTNAAS